MKDTTFDSSNPEEVNRVEIETAATCLSAAFDALAGLLGSSAKTHPKKILKAFQAVEEAKSKRRVYLDEGHIVASAIALRIIGMDSVEEDCVPYSEIGDLVYSFAKAAHAIYCMSDIKLVLEGGDEEIFGSQYSTDLLKVKVIKSSNS